MNDEQLLNASIEFDNFLVEFSDKHELPALLATSIALARLVHLNKQYGDKKDFLKLLHAITDSTVFDAEEKVTH